MCTGKIGYFSENLKERESKDEKNNDRAEYEFSLDNTRWQYTAGKSHGKKLLC
jgi:hypothetical protein